MNELFRVRDKLKQELEQLPTFKDYTSVCRAIELIEEVHEGVTSASKPSSETISSASEVILESTPERKEALRAAIDAHFEKTNKRPISVKNLEIELKAEGVEIHGIKATTTLAATLNSLKDKYEQVNGLWCVIDSKQQNSLLRDAA